MKNKYFPDEDIDLDALYFVCYMIERVARHIRQKNKSVVNMSGKDVTESAKAAQQEALQLIESMR